MQIDENEVYTSEETQGLLKISRSTFLRLVKKGILKAAKIGGQYRILGRDLLHLISPSLEQGAAKVYKRVKNGLKKKLDHINKELGG
jgi:excisionase family DNA binding protein